VAFVVKCTLLVRFFGSEVSEIAPGFLDLCVFWSFFYRFEAFFYPLKGR